MLTFLSVAYLALPMLLFAVGWLRWPYAVLVCAALGVCLARLAYRALRRVESADDSRPPFSVLNLVLLLVVTLGLLRFSGVGGFGNQLMDDWLKHDAVLHDLVVQDWPVTYAARPQAPQGTYLTYYLAYYLPAAAVGKLAGVMAAHTALFLWTLGGLLLSAAWVLRLVGSRLWIIWAGWFLLSGMDAAGVMLRGGGRWVFLEWWASLAQYPSNLSILDWVPQHMLPAWLATAMVVDQAEREDLAQTGLVATLTGLWSPFVTVGLAPLALVLLWRGRLRSAWSFANLVAAPLVLAVSAIYLESVQYAEFPNEWNWARFEGSWFLRVYPVFLLLEFGIYAALVAIHLRRDRQGILPGKTWNGTWLAVVVLTLTLLPLRRLGICNDLVMRAGLPCLFLLWIVLLRVVVSPLFRLENWASSLLLLALLVGTIQPLYQLVSQIERTPGHRTFSCDALQVNIFDVPSDCVVQYLGRPDSFFVRHLLRAPAALSPPEPSQEAR